MRTPTNQLGLRCPACGYDVSRTLADGIDACPECGGAIDEASCAEAGRRGGGWRGAGVYLGLCFVAPLATVVIATGLDALSDTTMIARVLAALALYAGGTVCLLGWPTGAGLVVERLPARTRSLRSFLVFVALIVVGGVHLVAGAALGATLFAWLR